MFKKGIDVIVLLFDDTLYILMLHFFQTILFSLSSTVTSQGKDDDLLMYTISSPTLTPTPAPVHVKPPITQLYSWHQNPPVSSLEPAASSSNPV